MKNLEASFRALRVLHTAKDLFNQFGFHKVGVDRIIADSQIPKATFYNYFHSLMAYLMEGSQSFFKSTLSFSIVYNKNYRTYI
ncbi:TetR/AcrR family transcriptional regulator [Acinetobacter baumannii]|uniref:TetR/AcrR family transcriptional regulator n=1 Tax=Acinetobacter baumannii TaxID=470 RepID=A0A7S8WDG9_ACIBA|nr:TetR/AcrR family transcriptional regulator [Acinetobacter baumannii]QPF13202.1 TetR/AcrR family transcriptional regulator [Acinetobacter baumannii]HCT3679328.1 TetR/AcrR family transcriptional regulator [Acinetobacter baumannii]